MVITYPKIWRGLLISSCLAVLLSLFFPQLSASPTLAAALILLVGVPHGAADHRLFQQLYQARYGRSALYVFYLGYLGLMALVAFLWWQFPVVALLLFLSLSAYHFGQGNFSYFSRHSAWHQLFFFLWGTWVIATPVLLHYESAAPIIEGLLGSAPTLNWPPDTVAMATLVAGALLWLGLLPQTLAIRWREGLSLLALWCLFFYTPLLLGFAVYFAGWHALPSALDQVQFLRQQQSDFRTTRYLLIIIPFSLLALFGVLFSAYFMQNFANIETPWSAVFAFIAAVTLPHMLVLDRVYVELNS